MRIVLFLLVILLLQSCSNKLSILEDRYKEVKTEIRKSSQEIKVLMSSFPIEYQRKMRSSINLIMTNSLPEFQSLTNMSDHNLGLLLENIEKYMINLEKARQFIPNESHADLYEKIKTKMLTREKEIRKYIKALEGSGTQATLQVSVFLSKVF